MNLRIFEKYFHRLTGKYALGIEVDSCHLTGDRPATAQLQTWRGVMGKKLRPIITENMIKAGRIELSGHHPDFESIDDAVVRIFCAMLEASASSETLKSTPSCRRRKRQPAGT